MGTIFGLGIPATAVSGHDPVAQALAAERSGFDFVSASDHPCGTAPTHETWTMLTWLAARTSRIGICTKVLGVPYRVPAMVAKMAATLDLLSGGRMILGLGGGSADDEFLAFGLSVPTAREKVDGLEDAVRIIRGLWTRPSFTYSGPIHHTHAADLEPKPARHIPLWLGTFGPRALSVTGRLADGWIPTLGFASLEALVAMRDRVVDAAVGAGRDPAEITLALNLSLRVGDAGGEPDAVSGTPDALAERLRQLASLGFTGFNLQLDTDDAGKRLQWIDLLGTSVLPHVRAT